MARQTVGSREAGEGERAERGRERMTEGEEDGGEVEQRKEEGGEKNKINPINGPHNLVVGTEYTYGWVRRNWL